MGVPHGRDLIDRSVYVPRIQVILGIKWSGRQLVAGTANVWSGSDASRGVNKIQRVTDFQMARERTYIRHRSNRSARQLPLNGEVVVVGSGVDISGIDRAAAHAPDGKIPVRSQELHVGRSAVKRKGIGYVELGSPRNIHEGIGKARAPSRGTRSVGSNRIGWDPLELQIQFFFGAVIVHAKTTPDAGLAGAACNRAQVRTVRKTNTRSKVAERMIGTGGVNALIARVDDSERRVRKDGGLLPWIKRRHSMSAIGEILHRCVNLPTQSVGEREVRPQFPLVLEIAVVFLGPVNAIAAALLRVEIGDAEQEVRPRIAGTERSTAVVEVEAAVLSEERVVDLESPHVKAGFHGVTAVGKREVIHRFIGLIFPGLRTKL